MKSKLLLLFIFYLIPFSYLQVKAQHWGEADSSIGSVADFDVLNNSIYTISNLGLFAYSSDNCETWTTKDIRDVATLSNPIFTSITFFDNHNGLVAIRNDQTGNQFLQTFDGGETWEVLPNNFDLDCSSEFIPIDLDRINDSTAILSLNLARKYYVTKDRGNTWTCSDPFSAPDALQVKSIRSETEWIFNSSDGLYKTIDGGLSWTLIFDKNFTYFHTRNDNEIYGITGYYDEANRMPVLYKSTDDFLTHEAIELSQFEEEYIDLFVYESEDNVYIRTRGKDIHYSSDGGQSFEFLQRLTNEPFRTSFENDQWYLYGRGLWKWDKSLVPLNELNIEDELMIYPNPVSNLVYIKNQAFTSYELIAFNGRKVEAGLLINGQIDMSNLNAGLYILKVFQAKEVFNYKILKL